LREEEFKGSLPPEAQSRELGSRERRGRGHLEFANKMTAKGRNRRGSSLQSGLPEFSLFPWTLASNDVLAAPIFRSE